jgi:hypothetical protein
MFDPRFHRIFFFNLLNPISLSMALGFTQPLTQLSTTFLCRGGGKARPVRKADNLTALSEPIV